MPLKKILFAILTIVINECVFSQAVTLKIGAIFDTEDRTKESAFHLAIDKINSKKILKDSIYGLVKHVPPNDPFKALLATCDLLLNGVIAILGPSTHQNSHMVQTICDDKDIPFLDVRKVNRPTNPSVSFYPYREVLTQVYMDLLNAWHYKDFVILYEDDDSLTRIGDLLKTYDNKGHQVLVRKLDKHQNGDYRPTLKEVWRSGATHFVLDCSAEILQEVLSHAQQVGLMTHKQYYIITNLDMHTLDLAPFQYSETNITGMRFIDPDDDHIKDIATELFKNQDTKIGFMPSWKLQLESALIIDAILMFGKVLSELPQNFVSPVLDCASDGTWMYGSTLINLLKGTQYPGLTGIVQFDNMGFRSSFGLEITELKEGGIIKIGNWSYQYGLNISRVYPPAPPPAVEGSLVNKTFTIITALTEPYGMRKESAVPLYGNERYEGFGIDLISELSKRLGFNYTFIIREDKKNGEYDETTGRWNGMIGDVMYGVADLAITDLTITSERAEAVDFTTAFMNLGISILYHKPQKAPPSFFSFADPFSLGVWKLLAVAFFGVSLALFILGRFAPSEWQNPYPCVDEPDYLVNQLSLRNCFWFMTGSLMQQGSEIAPTAMSTRMLAGSWWFFTLLMVSSYTANLAAFLTSENPDNPFNDVYELAHVAEEKGIKFGAKINGSTEKFFRDSKHSEEFQKIYQYMKAHPKLMVEDNKLGVIKAEQENYAFFMETTSIEYETQRRCTLTSVGNSLDEKGYGIAMRKNSSYRYALSTTILKLQEDGVVAKLKRKWWEELRGGGQCPDDDEKPQEGTPLNLKNVGGVFWVTIIGTLFSLVLVFVEMALHTFKRSILIKKPFKTLLAEELKFYFKTSGMAKPVIYDNVEERSNKSRSTPSRKKAASYGFNIPQ